jgi:hypothetical protein
VSDWYGSFGFFFIERGEALGWKVGQKDSTVKVDGGRKERIQEHSCGACTWLPTSNGGHALQPIESGRKQMVLVVINY